MGLFSKKKNDEQEKIGVKGMPVNPKILGGPSTTAGSAVMSDGVGTMVSIISIPAYQRRSNLLRR